MRQDPEAAGALLREAGLTILGERHGTNEFPELMLRLARAAAQEGPLTVALELADDAQEATSAYLRADDAGDHRSRMLSTPSWQRDDGRGSLAMLRLLDGLRELVGAGAHIEVDVFDTDLPGAQRSAGRMIEREMRIADRLLAISKRGTTLALAGNVHAEQIARPDAPSEFVPAAALAAERTRLISLVGRHGGGASWCTLPVDGHLVAAAHPVEGRDQGAEAFVEIEPGPGSCWGIAYVGRITPSPPTTGGDGVNLHRP